jgi:carbonic anhydrase
MASAVSDEQAASDETHAAAADGPMAEYERILAENRRYVDAFDRSALTAAPLSGIAILACMDARLDVEEALGLRTGDAHIIRNAGGLATDDAIRSLVVSQELLGTDQVVVIGHTHCGLEGQTDQALREALIARTGSDVPMEFGSFPAVESSVRSQVERIRDHPWIRDVAIHGLIFDVETGELIEVA